METSDNNLLASEIMKLKHYPANQLPVELVQIKLQYIEQNPAPTHLGSLLIEQTALQNAVQELNHS